MDIIIPTSDILYINNLAKALKSKNFIWYQDNLIGRNDDTHYSSICKISWERMQMEAWPERGLLINQRNFSMWSNTITIEPSFTIKGVAIAENTSIITTENGSSLEIKVSNYIDKSIRDELKMLNGINNNMSILELVDVTKMVLEAIDQSKVTKMVSLQPDIYHNMMIPLSALPITKSDRVSLSILDNFDRTFTARFIIDKKIAMVSLYFTFLKL